MTSFLDLAGDDSDVAAPPAPVAPTKKKTFLDLAGPPPKADKPEAAASDPAGAPLLALSPKTRAAVLADVAKTGARDFTVNGMPPEATGPGAPQSQAGAGRGTMPASAYAPPQPVLHGAEAIPGYQAPAPRPPEPSTLQKIVGGHEAALAGLTGMTTGFAGGITGGLKSLMTGHPVEAGFNEGARAMTYSPRTASGQDQAENVGNAMSYYGPSVVGIGPEIGAVGKMIAGAPRYAATEAPAAAAGFREAAPRVEPTFGEAPQAGAASPAAAGAAPAAAPVAGTTPTSAPQAATAPTLAQASPELQRAVASMGGKAPPEAVARHVEAETLPVPGKLTTGQAAQDPALISSEMNSRGKGQAAPVPPEFYQQQGKTLAANMDAIRGTAAPDIPTSASIVDHGQTLLDAYKTKDASVTADISAKYKALADANGGSLPVSGTDFVASADAALAKQMKGRYVPKEIAADMEAFRQGGPMTFEDFENLRTNLAAEGRKADRAGDGNAAGAINIVRNSLEQLPITGETAAIKPLADAARSAAKARFDAIKADPAYKAAVNDSTELGQPSPAADRFFNSYVRDGARENVARMRANLEDHPQATQTIAAGILDHLKGQLKADPVTGNFSQANYNKALQTLGPKMGSLVDPTTAQQLQAVGGFAKNAQTQPRGSYVNNSNTAVELAAHGVKAAAEHGTNMLFGGIPVGTVVRKAGGYVADRAGMAKASNQALDPSAGLARLSDLVKKGPP